MFDLSLALGGLALIATLAFATWLVSLWRRDVSIVDGMWPVFIAAAGGYYAASSRLAAGATLMFALLIVWAARLCVHITVRNHGQPEDRRYQKIRANNQPHFEIRSLYIVFGFQALLAWIVALPFMAIARGVSFGWLGIAAALLAAGGIAYESAADWFVA